MLIDLVCIFNFNMMSNYNTSWKSEGTGMKNTFHLNNMNSDIVSWMASASYNSMQKTMLIFIRVFLHLRKSEKLPYGI